MITRSHEGDFSFCYQLYILGPIYASSLNLCCTLKFSSQKIVTTIAATQTARAAIGRHGSVAFPAPAPPSPPSHRPSPVTNKHKYIFRVYSDNIPINTSVIKVVITIYIHVNYMAYCSRFHFPAVITYASNWCTVKKFIF